MNLPASPFLYPILDSNFSRDLIQDGKALIKAGVQIFQIRAKDRTRGYIFEIASALAPECNDRKVILVVNDCVDIAMITENAGVHLGQSDFPVLETRKLLPGRIIGISTHNERQFLIANEWPVDYIAIGPMYRTSTKTESGSPLGITFLEAMRKSCDLPIVCIGGVGPHQLGDLIRAGADGIAMISHLYKGDDLYSSARRLLDQLQSAAHS